MKRALFILLASAATAFGAQISGLTTVTSLTNADYLIADVYTNSAYVTRSILYQNAVPPVYQSATIIVDSTYGSDTTGARGTARPYATLSAALAALQSGDLMILRPGIHSTPAQMYGNDDETVTLTHGIVGKTNVTVYGPGAVLYSTNYGSIFTIESCTNITLDGLEFRYRDFTTNEIASGAGTNWPIVAAVNHRRTNYLTTVRNCRFVNIVDQCVSHLGDVYGRPSYNWTVTGCYFEDIGTTNFPFSTGTLPDGAMVSGRPRRLIFSGNRSDGLCVYGIELDGGGTLSPSGDSFGETVISGNNLRGIYKYGPLLMSTSNSIISNVTISGNHFEFHDLGLGALVQLSGTRNVLISGNTFKGGITSDAAGQRRYGVLLGGTYGNHPAWSNTVITANAFIGMSYGAATALVGTGLADRLYGLTITDNVFHDQGESHVLAAGSGITIARNTFLGCGRTTSPTYPRAIWTYDFGTSGPLSATIRDNVLNDIGSTATTTYFYVASLSGTNSTGKTVLENNRIERMSGTTPYLWTAGYVARSVTSVAASGALAPLLPRYYIAGDGGNVTVTNLPSVGDAFDGVTIELIGTSDSATVTYQDDGTLSGSALQLGSTNRVLGIGDTLTLRYDMTEDVWCEVSYINQ